MIVICCTSLVERMNRHLGVMQEWYEGRNLGYIQPSQAAYFSTVEGGGGIPYSL